MQEMQVQELINENLLIMEVKVCLNESDISNLDFSIPIFVNSPYGNSYFKLLELTYTNSNIPSQVKLQKIVYKSNLDNDWNIGVDYGESPLQ